MTRFFHVLLMVVFINSNAIGQTKIMHSNQKNNANVSVSKDFLTYTVNVSESNSRCQILINDVPLMYYEGKGPRSFYANGAILDSGKQSIKIIPDGKMPIVTINETKNEPGAYRETEIWKNEGLGQGMFSATVPYNNIGWAQGKVISDNKIVHEQAMQWFTQMGLLLKAGKGKEFMKELIPTEKTAAAIFNLKPEETEKFHSNWIDYINRNEYVLVPIAHCKLEIVGNGKLAHLVNEFKEGGIALKANNGQMLFLDIYLQLPNGRGEIEPVLTNFKQITSNFKKLSE